MKFTSKIQVSIVILSLLSVLAVYFDFATVPIAAEPPKAGIYQLIIPGDAYGFHSMCQMFQDLKVKNLQFSTTLDSYVPLDYSLDVKNLGFEVTGDTNYKLSVNGLKDFTVAVSGLDSLYVRCGDGDFDFFFSGDRHSLDLYGILKGNVRFGIFIFGFEEYEYEGPRLMIHIHIGNPFIDGDTNKDGKVDMIDIATIAKIFGLDVEDPGYMLNVDVDFNGKVDMRDIGIASAGFGSKS